MTFSDALTPGEVNTVRRALEAAVGGPFFRVRERLRKVAAVCARLPGLRW